MFVEVRSNKTEILKHSSCLRLFDQDISLTSPRTNSSSQKGIVTICYSRKLRIEFKKFLLNDDCNHKSELSDKHLKIYCLRFLESELVSSLLVELLFLLYNKVAIVIKEGIRDERYFQNASVPMTLNDQQCFQSSGEG